MTKKPTLSEQVKALTAEVERLKSVVERWEREEEWRKGQELIATRKSLGLP